MTPEDRWPAWVYAGGEEPDYRFSFANERTFLAWIRTALALLAAGVAVDALDLAMSPGVQRFVAAVLVVLGLVCASLAWWRWARAERAIRRREPLPDPRLGVAVAASLVVISIVLVIVTV